ncbi:unnamed protein product, partial [Pelagomonas calceolata]
LARHCRRGVLARAQRGVLARRRVLARHRRCVLGRVRRRVLTPVRRHVLVRHGLELARPALPLSAPSLFFAAAGRLPRGRQPPRALASRFASKGASGLLLGLASRDRAQAQLCALLGPQRALLAERPPPPLRDLGVVLGLGLGLLLSRRLALGCLSLALSQAFLALRRLGGPVVRRRTGFGLRARCKHSRLSFGLGGLGVDLGGDEGNVSPVLTAENTNAKTRKSRIERVGIVTGAVLVTLFFLCHFLSSRH